jgi:hypothetical protein
VAAGSRGGRDGCACHGCFHSLACPVHPGLGRTRCQVEHGCCGRKGVILENDQANQMQVLGVLGRKRASEILVQCVLGTGEIVTVQAA